MNQPIEKTVCLLESDMITACVRSAVDEVSFTDEAGQTIRIHLQAVYGLDGLKKICDQRLPDLIIAHVDQPEIFWYLVNIYNQCKLVVITRNSGSISPELKRVYELLSPLGIESFPKSADSVVKEIRDRIRSVFLLQES